MSLKVFRPLFEPIFLQALRQKAQAAAACVPDAFVADVVRYPEALAAGDGKRVRPYLAWLLAGARTQPAIIRCIAALECFHLFALVHDDVMDRGATRRGIPTTHAYAEARMTQAHRRGDIAHVAQSQAILVGDLLFQWAHELFDEGAALFPEAHFGAARTAFNAMVNEVIVGQMIDIDLTTRRDVAPELIQAKMRLKTASYTFVRPMHIGLALAGSDPQAAWATSFGDALGMAFQIQDDLLDLTATNETSGKTPFADLRANQPTVFTQHIMQHGTAAARAELASLMGADLTEAHREQVTRLFTDAGAFAAGNAEIARLLDQANAALQDAPASLKPPLSELLQVVQQRTS